MARDVRVAIIGDASSLRRALFQSEQGLENFQRKLNDTADRMRNWGAGLSAAVTLPAAIAAKSLVDSASSMQESMSKVNVVFAESSKVITDFASTAAKSMGISEQQALETAGTFGNLFRAMKVGEAQAAEMSVGLVQLASDLASFNNADPTEVLEALRSGLVGETEPMRRFGVSLSAARIEAKALEMGLEKVGGEFTAGAKATAAYAIIMEDTTLAQGDFARTSGGVANQQRILRARFEDLKATLGERLLPYAQQLLTWAQDAISAFEDLDPRVMDIALAVAAFAAAIGPLMLGLSGMTYGISQVIGVVTALTSPLTWIVGAVALLGGAILYASGAWPEFNEKVNEVVETVKREWPQIEAKIRETFHNVVEWLKNDAWPAFKTGVETLWQNLTDWLRNEGWPRFKEAAISVWNSLSEWIKNDAWPLISNAVGGWAAETADKFWTAWGKFWSVEGRTKITAAGDDFKTWIVDNAPKAVDAGQTWGSELTNGITSGIDQGAASISSAITRLGNEVTGEGILHFVKAGRDWSAGLFMALVGGVGRIIASAIGWGAQIGVSIYKGLQSIMISLAGAIAGFIMRSVQSMWNGIREGISKLPGIENVLGPAYEGVTGKPKPRAVGGPMSAGMPYLVGETGPELFVPNSNGLLKNAASTSALTAGPGISNGGSEVIQIMLDGRVLAEYLREYDRGRR